jgi:hypothetical protein
MFIAVKIGYNRGSSVSATMVFCAFGTGVHLSRCRRMLHTTAGANVPFLFVKFASWFPFFRLLNCCVMCIRCFGLAINPFHDQLTVRVPRVFESLFHFHSSGTCISHSYDVVSRPVI